MGIRRRFGSPPPAELRRAIALGAFAALFLTAGCDQSDTLVEPAPPSVDERLRRSLAQWGVVPILPVPAQNPALVELGRALVFDKELSGNRDVSCATCHQAQLHGADGLSLAIGTGASGTGLTREPRADGGFLGRNAPSLLNLGLGSFYMFWDGRVAEEGFRRFVTPAGGALPSEITSLLAAQAMFPVVSREEMRGHAGDVDVFGQINELALLEDEDFAEVWRAVMRRLLAIPGYVAMFRAAFPATPESGLRFQHAASAIAAFEVQAYSKKNSPFDRYLGRDNAALSPEAKRGALLFFGEALCASCHFGPLLGGQSFANTGVPQLGPGVGRAAPLDAGRGEVLDIPQYRFAFRVPSLRNVELTAPYMHNGALPTLEAVIKHYDDVPKALREYDVTQVDPRLRASHHGEEETIEQILSTLDFRLQFPLRLTDAEQGELIAFLKSLTDPAARDLGALVPASVPSGLPVHD